jgi:hypothetical protein
MSWWLPSNGKKEEYLKNSFSRVIIVFVVWSPILFTLGNITSTKIQVLISTLVFVAFGLRLYLFDKALHQSIQGHTKLIEPNKIPEILYFTALLIIGWVIFYSVPNSQWLVPLAILAIYIGAFIMASYRCGIHKNFIKDVIGRIIFTLGFILNTFNLARATEII